MSDVQLKRFYRLGYKMEYPVQGFMEKGGEVPYLLREIIIDLGKLTFVQIEQSSQDKGDGPQDQGCSMLISGHKGAIEMPLEGAEKLRDEWLAYNGYRWSDGEFEKLEESEKSGEISLVDCVSEKPQ